VDVADAEAVSDALERVAALAPIRVVVTAPESASRQRWWAALECTRSRHSPDQGQHNCPGLLRTGIFDLTSEDVVESSAKQVPHPARLGDPDKFALLLAHIVVNPMIDGEAVRLDGALRMAAK
jgi:hypothetical protein